MQDPWQIPAMQVWLELAHDVWLVHPPLELHVCGISPLQRTWFGAHTPVQLEPMHVWLVNAAGALHWPRLLHVSTPFDWHCTVPDTHTPLQTPVPVPLTQVELTQAVAAPHIPFAAHVSTLLPEHCVVPGLQLPVHSAAVPPSTATGEQMLEQATVVPHVPVALHVWTPFPLHLVSPGAQTPAHAPLVHVWFVQATGEPHFPVMSHVSTPLFTHCVAPVGPHATQADARQTEPASPAHVVWFPHSPAPASAAPHAWMFGPLHCV